MSTAAVALPMRRARRRSPRVLAAVIPAALVGAFLASNLQASLAQRTLRQQWAKSVADARDLSPIDLARRTYARGEAVARLHIPAMALDAVVVEGADPAQVRRGPAHLASSPIPGEDGMAVITGNRLGFGGFLGDLDRLRIGDRIEVETLAGPVTFIVSSVDVVSADQLDLTSTGTRPMLMLFAGAKRWGGGDRIVVRAEESAP